MTIAKSSNLFDFIIYVDDTTLSTTLERVAYERHTESVQTLVSHAHVTCYEEHI